MSAMNNNAKSNSNNSSGSTSSNSNSNSTVNSSVKQERQDDPEIRELAAKFVEANKAKMAVPQRNQPALGQNVSILSFLNSDKSKPVQLTNSTEETKNIDEESAKGRFGWTSMGKVHIPYIIRSGENYCAVRMVEMKVLNKWLNYLHQDLYNCTNIRSYYITEVEARLLNEINLKHCDYQFGKEQFTSRDLIVRLSDANEFYQFLGHCYHKLVNTLEPDMPNRCGFIRINRESVVPYTVYNDQKYVPLFYFEGETDNLKQRADKLEGWDLSYLKFCCKVQGIRNELFAHDSCSVISLNDIKNYFPPGTVFEDYWPKKNLDSSQLLISGRTSLPHNVHWTRQPVAPPITAHPSPSPKPATQAKAATNGPMHNVHVYSNSYAIAGGQPPYHAAQPRAASSAVRANYPTTSARHMRPAATNYYGAMGQAPPPPLVRSATIPDHEQYFDGPYTSEFMIRQGLKPEYQIETLLLDSHPFFFNLPRTEEERNICLNPFSQNTDDYYSAEMDQILSEMDNGFIDSLCVALGSDEEEEEDIPIPSMIDTELAEEENIGQLITELVEENNVMQFKTEIVEETKIQQLKTELVEENNVAQFKTELVEETKIQQMKTELEEDNNVMQFKTELIEEPKIQQLKTELVEDNNVTQFKTELKEETKIQQLKTELVEEHNFMQFKTELVEERKIQQLKTELVEDNNVTQFKTELVEETKIQQLKTELVEVKNLRQMKTELVEENIVEQFKTELGEERNIKQLKTELIKEKNVRQFEIELIDETNKRQLKRELKEIKYTQLVKEESVSQLKNELVEERKIKKLKTE